ncbi:hypothetical protein J2X14_002124 [Pantoea alhagi]|uniref:type III secretion system inner rod subunit SctI n=1 Tax=Mixta sp. BE291 TaxID=3158787 RepID=UPI0028651EDE|nr:hypothetical protein [Pantoea alhagi]
MSITISDISKLAMPEQEPEFGLSLEGMLKKALSEASEEQYSVKLGELERVKDYRNTITPEDLYVYQSRASEYNLTVSLYSALTRKAVTAIDTVIRA